MRNQRRVSDQTSSDTLRAKLIVFKVRSRKHYTPLMRLVSWRDAFLPNHLGNLFFNDNIDLNCSLPLSCVIICQKKEAVSQVADLMDGAMYIER